MRPFERSTFIFVSTNTEHAVGGVEERWLAIMSELVQLGSTVHFLCFAHSPLADPARRLGVTIGPYILDKWNVIRSRSRLRKYLRRYEPVCAHSTGVEADLLLRWAARKVPNVRIAATISTPDPQHTRRRRPINALMLRFDEAGLPREDMVFLANEELLDEVVAAGVPMSKIVLDVVHPQSDGDDIAASVARHLEVYRTFMASRGQGA